MHGTAALILAAVLTGGGLVADPPAATFAEHSPIVVRIDVLERPSGDRVETAIDWTTSDTRCQLRVVGDGSTVHVWAPPGAYVLSAKILRINWSQQTYAIETRSTQIAVLPADDPPTPPDPDDPDPPTPDPTEPVSVVVITDTDTETPEQSSVLLTLRHSEIFIRGPPQLLILSRDAVDQDDRPHPVVAQYVRRVPPGSALPYAFFVEASQVAAPSDQSVVHAESLPADPQVVIDRVEASIR